MTQQYHTSLLSVFPGDLRDLIFSNLGGEQKYWKGIFSHYVLPQLNKGWREVGEITSPCRDCKHYHGFVIPNPECSSCFFLEPCINCYWYNSDPYDIGDVCQCSKSTTLITWEDMMAGTELLAKYPLYEDFLHGEEWTCYLREQAALAMEIDQRFEQAWQLQATMPF